MFRIGWGSDERSKLPELWEVWNRQQRWVGCHLVGRLMKQLHRDSCSPGTSRFTTQPEPWPTRMRPSSRQKLARTSTIRIETSTFATANSVLRLSSLSVRLPWSLTGRARTGSLEMSPSLQERGRGRSGTGEPPFRRAWAGLARCRYSAMSDEWSVDKSE